MKKIHLGIRGGGVKTPGIGVMKVLEENNIKIASYSGASIGAVLATLGAVNTSSDEILYLVKKFVEEYSNACRLKGGEGSSIIEETVNNQCSNMRFKDLKKPLFITANKGGLWNTQMFLFSKETTPEVTLGEACRASCSFPGIYERYSLSIGKDKMKFFDGGMVSNPYTPCTQNVKVLATFRKSKTNMKSRYKDAWRIPEEKADFVIKPYLGKMGSLGTEDDIKMASILGYYETLENLDSLLKILN